MASELTRAQDLVVPEVWADAIGPRILGKAVLAPLAELDDTLVGQPGDTINMTKYGYIGDAEDLSEGVAMETDRLVATDYPVTIKEVGKAVELTDKAVLTAIGNPNDQARQQIALSVSRKIDSDLRAAAEYEHTNAGGGDPIPTTAPLKLSVNGPLSWNVLTRAFALWGDEYDPSEVAGILVHSAQAIQLMNDPNFLSADKFGPGAVIMRGQIGAIGTIPVITSDRATAVADVDPGAGTVPGAKAILLRKGAIALRYKRRPIVETDRDILRRTNIITTNAHYAAHRTLDHGVIVLTTSVAIPEA